MECWQENRHTDKHKNGATRKRISIGWHATHKLSGRATSKFWPRARSHPVGGLANKMLSKKKQTRLSGPQWSIEKVRALFSNPAPAAMAHTG